jgi:hypothetical protein
MKRIFFKENDKSYTSPNGYSIISYRGGEMVISDYRFGEKSVSSSGEQFISSGKVYSGQLAYLNEDGFVTSPQSIEKDDNKADNIIGVILNDADEGELVNVLNRGIWNGFSNDEGLNISPRSILYIDTDGNLTTTTTPYVFGKVLIYDTPSASDSIRKLTGVVIDNNSDSLNNDNNSTRNITDDSVIENTSYANRKIRTSVMVDINFIQSTLTNYGIFPSFSKLRTIWEKESDRLNITWESKDKISSFELISYYSINSKLKSDSRITESTSSLNQSNRNTIDNLVNETLNFEENPLESGDSIDLSELLAYSDIESGSILVCRITSEDDKSVDFKFELTGKSDSKSYSYYGKAIQWSEDNGIFRDGEIEGVIIDINLLENGTWFLGRQNGIPLRSLFSTRLVDKDESGLFIFIVTPWGDVKIYNSLIWELVDENVTYRSEIDITSDDINYELKFRVLDGDNRISIDRTRLRTDENGTVLFFSYLPGYQLTVKFYDDNDQLIGVSEAFEFIDDRKNGEASTAV